MIILGHLESEDKQKRFCFYSVTQWRPTFCDPTDCSRAGFSVLHHLPELAQTLVHWVGDTISSTISSSVPFLSCLLSFPASGSFPMSWLLTTGGQIMKRQNQKGYGGKLDHIWVGPPSGSWPCLASPSFVSSIYFSVWNFAFKE